MITEIQKLPSHIKEITPLIDKKIRDLFDFNELLSIKEVVVVGCGDSYMSGVATKHAFEKFSHIPVQAILSMQAARYDLIESFSSFPRNPLVLGVSVSGTVARTYEAIGVARDGGSLTVGITSNPDSPLSQAAEKTLVVPSPESLMAPGVSSYRTSMISLYLMGIRLGEVSGLLAQSEADAIRNELMGLGESIEKTIEKNIENIKLCAESLAEAHQFVFLGSGPNEASALFCAAKMIEANGRNSIGQDIEEWAHLQYFENGYRETPTFLIVPPGNSHTRASELIEPMQRVGRVIIGVVSEDEKEITGQADWSFPIVGQIREIFSPLVYSVVGEIFAAYFTDVINASYFRTSDEAYTSGDNTIRSSKAYSRSDFLD
jgi:glucosamine--fructose-6-phosphate aminotransferase (isomerizing)